MPTEKATLGHMLQVIKTFKASYYGFQETKVNQQHHERITQINKACVKAMNTKPKLQSNTTSYVQSQYQPGGLAVITCRGLDSKKNLIEKDPTSLIQTTTIHSNEVRLKILNVYWPPDSTGSLLTHMQTTNTIQKLGLQPHATNVTEYFYRTLSKVIEHATVDGYSVLIG